MSWTHVIIPHVLFLLLPIELPEAGELSLLLPLGLQLWG